MNFYIYSYSVVLNESITEMFSAMFLLWLLVHSPNPGWRKRVTLMIYVI